MSPLRVLHPTFGTALRGGQKAHKLIVLLLAQNFSTKTKKRNNRFPELEICRSARYQASVLNGLLSVTGFLRFGSRFSGTIQAQIVFRRCLLSDFVTNVFL